MILVLGGTTEGRIATRTLDQAGKPFYYSTRGEEQEIESKNGIRLTGGLEADELIDFVRSQEIRLLVDAAHPFAINLHHNVEKAASACAIPVIRLERKYPTFNSSCILCEDYQDAIERMETYGVRRLLALTGVQTIGKLAGFWKQYESFFRILDRDSSFALAEKYGFPTEKLLTYSSTDATETLIRQYGADAVITKESGDSGGFDEKQTACFKLGIPLFVVKRPALPSVFFVVTGEFGLRRAVERFVPDFYPLRIGFTTGSCATVAAKSALWALLGRGAVREMEFSLPNGETMKMPVDRVEKKQECAIACVTKDAGDDPDVTHGETIMATVSFCVEPGIHFLQGKGVGKVTLPGIGLSIGEPAINKVPRQMIQNELRALYCGGLNVTISVPRGEELATKTFNPKLGIKDGISILGTLGIVRPFSLEAWTESIEREIEVAIALGAERLVFNSGAKSERSVKELYPDLPSQAFIHYGNFIGSTLSAAEKKGVGKVTLGIMLGKAVKLAAGHLDTHSKKAILDKEFLKNVAIEADCTEGAVAQIEDMVLAREFWTKFGDTDRKLFLTHLMKHCYKHCMTTFSGDLTLLLISEDGEVFNLLA